MTSTPWTLTCTDTAGVLERWLDAQPNSEEHNEVIMPNTLQSILNPGHRKTRKETSHDQQL